MAAPTAAQMLDEVEYNLNAWKHNHRGLHNAGCKIADVAMMLKNPALGPIVAETLKDAAIREFVAESMLMAAGYMAYRECLERETPAAEKLPEEGQG